MDAPSVVVMVPRDDDPEAIAIAMLAACTPGVTVSTRCRVWSLCLAHDPLIGWIFSAKCVEPQVPLEPEDWQLLGYLAAAVGVPEDRVPPSSIDSSDPHVAHRWHWSHASMPADQRKTIDDVMARVLSAGGRPIGTLH